MTYTLGEKGGCRAEATNQEVEPVRAEALRAEGAGELTQTELADRAPIPVGTLRNLEQGHRDNPSLDTLTRLADVLGCSLDEFRGLAGKSGPAARSKRKVLDRLRRSE